MTTGTWVLIGVIVAALISLFAQRKKKRWYFVTTADKAQLTLYRQMGDWWFGDNRGMMLYHYPDGHRIKLSTHWILKIEEIVGEVEDGEK